MAAKFCSHFLCLETFDITLALVGHHHYRWR